MSNRPWFRIHLSTAIVLMFVAGGLIWANVVPSTRQSIGQRDRSTVKEELTHYGWPLIFCESEVVVGAIERPKQPKDYGIFTHALGPKYESINIALDVFSAFAIIAFTYFTIESLIRRHENRVAPPPQTSNT